MNMLRAGAAKADITPKEALLPLPLLGPLQFTRINDHIFVRVLALESGNRRALVATFDLTFVPDAEGYKEALFAAFHIPEEYIFLAATHTHEAVPLFAARLLTREDDASKSSMSWKAHIKEGLMKAAGEAIASLRPARMGAGTGKSYINCNRDEIKSGEKAELGYNFERPSDKTLRAVRLEDEAGAPIAFLVNYACHAVVMNGCIERGGVGVSGDFPGRTASVVEARHGGVCLWTSSAAGDQNPRMMTNFGVKVIDGKPVYQNLGETGHLVLELLTEEHVRDVERTLETIRCAPFAGEIAAGEGSAFCPRTDGGETEYRCTLLKAGGLTLAGVDGEVPTSIGAAILNEMKEEAIFISLVNGYKGYIPDDWQLEHHSFEAEGAPLASGYAEQSLKETFRRLDAEINGGNL